ncbi:MAG: hypothetical protein EP343_30885 [Deltaproteobacteria bacterium]|nr:MAG: hypothetical protein EP343_30885 [Deltaproteobacteria bacterium]
MKRYAWTLGLILVVWTCFVYSFSFQSPFEFDDIPVIQKNAYIRSFSHVPLFFKKEIDSRRGFSSHFRPLTMMTFSVNYAAHGLSPWGYRCVNLLLHLGCGLLLFLIVLRLLLGLSPPSLQLSERDYRWAAFVATSLFLVHPIHSLSVLMVWKRTTLLVALFYLLAVWLFLKVLGVGQRSSDSPSSYRWRMVGIVVCMVLGICSKEIIVTLPAVLLMLTLCCSPDGGKASLRRTWPLHGLLWCIVVVQWLFLFPGKVASRAEAGAWEYLLTQTKVIWFYLNSVVFPDSLSVSYDTSIVQSLWSFPVLMGSIALLALFVLAIFAVRRWPLVSVVLLWWFFTLAPTSSFVPGPLLADENRTYLPFLSVWLTLGLLLALVLRGSSLRRWGGTVLFAVAILGFSMTTVQRSILWRDSIKLWSNSVTKYPGASNVNGWINLCNELVERRLFQRGLAVCEAALRQKMLTRSSLYTNAALARVSLGYPKQASRWLKLGLATYPRNHRMLQTAGNLAWFQGHPKEAIPFYQKTLSLHPSQPKVRLYYAASLMEVGQVKDSSSLLESMNAGQLDDLRSTLLYLRLLQEAGLFRKAETLLSRYRRRGSLRPEFLLEWLHLQCMKGKTKGVMERLAVLEGKARNNLSFLSKIARVYRRCRAFQQEIALWKGASLWASRSRRVTLFWTDAMLRSLQKDRACLHYKKHKKDWLGLQKDRMVRGAWGRLVQACEGEGSKK